MGLRRADTLLRFRSSEAPSVGDWAGPGGVRGLDGRRKEETGTHTLVGLKAPSPSFNPKGKKDRPPACRRRGDKTKVELETGGNARTHATH